MSHVRKVPFRPQTQGKIERWHQTLENRILIENYFLPGDLKVQIEALVEHYCQEQHYACRHLYRHRAETVAMMAR